MNRTWMNSLTVGVLVCVIALAAISGSTHRQANAQAANEAAAAKPQQAGGGDLGRLGQGLLMALKNTEGCLGVDAGEMISGKSVLFAWFEDKQAALRWYHSETHVGAMKMFFRDAAPGQREPMAGVPDNVPLMVIASITPADAAALQETTLPVSQIAIEVYAPMSGGLALGGRFAPPSLNVPDMRHYELPRPPAKPQ